MRDIFVRIFGILIVTLVYSCESGEETTWERDVSKNHTEVTVIIEGKSTNDTINYKDGSFSQTSAPSLIYVNPRKAYLHKNIIASSDSSQSIKILNTNPYIIVQSKIAYDDFDFLILRPGDSLLIDYHKNDYQVLNRDVLKYDLGLGDLISDMPMSVQESYTRNNLLFVNGMLSEEKKLNLKRVHAENEKLVKSFYKDLLLKIDSVHQAGQMSEEAYDAYITYYSFRSLTSKDAISFYEHATSLQQDSVFKYPFLRDRLFQYYSRLGYNHVRFASGIGVFDYKTVIDSVIANKNKLSTFTIDLLLYEFMERLAQSQVSSEEVGDYFEKFQKSIHDTTLVTAISANYFFDDIQVGSKNTVMLTNIGGKKTNLRDVLSTSNDSIFYIDFWASWCAPCIAEMPASKKLEEDIQNRPIGIIYLSIDKNIDNWIKSTSRLGLDSNPNNYLVINRDSSQFLRDINLTTIPRYLVINKEGKLLQSNAPSPSSEGIKRVLESMLSTLLN